MLTVLHEERFQDRSPAAVQAALLDEGEYLCSTRTMYRILEDEGESRERRDQAVLDAAYHAHPERFVRRPPKPLPLPSEVWINKPVPPGQTTNEESH